MQFSLTLQQLTVTFDDILDYGNVKITPEQPNLLGITELLSKPFNFVSGNIPKQRCNPFRRKSGILRVLERQEKRSRIMSKTGTLRTEGFVVTKLDKYLKDIFNSILYLVSASNERNPKLPVRSSQPKVIWIKMCPYFQKHGTQPGVL